MTETTLRKRSAEGLSAFFQDIFARKQAKGQLQFQATILRNVSEGVIVTDLDGHIVYWNEGAAATFGYTAEEMIGNSLAILYPDEVRAQFLPALQLIREGKDYVGEWRGQHKDGTPVWIDSKTTIMRNAEGEAIGLIGVSKDITERKRTDEARFLLATLVESSNDAIIGKTRQGIITTWNRAAERMYGYSAEEAVGQPITLIFPSHRQDEFAKIMEQITRGERVEHYETTRVRKDATTLAVSVTISPIKDSEGQIIGASTIARDITEQKRLVAEVRQSKQQLEVIFQNIVDGVAVQSADGTILYINEAGAKLCGYFSASEALASLGFQTQQAFTLQRFDLKDEQGNPFPLADLPGRRALCGETTPQAIVQYYDQVSQTRRWSRVKARPIVDEQDGVQLAVTIFSDITEAYEAEQRKDEFIGMASHELKTPITTLKGLTQLLKRRLVKQGLSEPIPVLSTMETQIERLTRLVNDLLDVTKIQAGLLDYAEDRLALDTLVRDIVEIEQQLTTTHTLTIHGVSNSCILGDSDRLGQVFLNLISNAIKYSPGADTVDIYVTSTEDRVIVRVRDYGVGIPKEHQSKIFDRFYRVSDGKNKAFPGLGMGLYISSEIVKRHGGEISFASGEGKGSTFTVSLPVLKKEVR